MTMINIHLSEAEIETAKRESYVDKEIEVECEECGESTTIQVRVWRNG